LNRRQKIALWCGVVAIVLMGLFPPWNWTYLSSKWIGAYTAAPSRVYEPKFAGYSFITTDRLLSNDRKDVKYGEVTHASWREGGRIDLRRLCIQWALVALVTGAVIVTSADKK